MKTTVEVSDSLLREARLYAARHDISLREVFERGLTAVLSGSKASRKKFRLKTIVTHGEGLQVDGSWETIRSFIYEGHGG